MQIDPVHITRTEGHDAVVRNIMTEDASFGDQMHDKGGTTALHTGTRFGRLEVAKDLLGCGADVHSRKMEECTARG